MPSSWLEVTYTHHQFVSRYGSHLYRDNLQQYQGQGLLEHSPVEMIEDVSIQA